MTNLIDADLLFFIALVPVCLIVACNDLKYMKIPNWTVITMIVIFVVLGFIVLPLNVFLWRFAGLVVALIAGFILSAMKMMGAGDAKFMAAAALFVSPLDAGYVVIMLALMGTGRLAFASHCRGLVCRENAARMGKLAAQARIPDGAAAHCIFVDLPCLSGLFLTLGQLPFKTPTVCHKTALSCLHPLVD